VLAAPAYGGDELALARVLDQVGGVEAATAVFLMANAYINGQIITIAGGQSLV